MKRKHYTLSQKKKKLTISFISKLIHKSAINAVGF